MHVRMHARLHVHSHERTEDGAGSGMRFPFRGLNHTLHTMAVRFYLNQLLMRIMISQYCKYRIDPLRGHPCHYRVNRRRSAETEVAV